MKKLLVAVLFFLGLVVSHLPAASAQEAENDKFSFGKVVSVAADQITVKEYDFAKDADVDVVYSVSTETELGNINAVNDLKADDDVVLDYVEKDGKRMVTTLVKEEKGAEVPAMEGEQAAPVAEVAPAADAAPVAPAVAAEVPVTNSVK